MIKQLHTHRTAVLGLLCLMALLILPVRLAALDFQYEHEGKTLTYTVLDENVKTAEVSRNSVSGNLVLPSKVFDGDTEYTLVRIGSEAFLGCSELTSITIPNSITSVVGSAFSGCDKLETVSIDGTPEGMVESGLFAHCNNLTIGSNVKVLPDLHKGLQKLTIYQGIEKFEACPDAWAYKIYLTDIDEWANSTPIGYFSAGCQQPGQVNFFYKDKPLKNISFGAKVERIGANAFASSTIESITFSDYLVEIGDYAFQWNSLSTLEIPEGVTSIGERAFYSSSSLQSVSLPSTLASIGEEAFWGNTALYEVNIPKNCKLTKIPRYLFMACSDLESIYIPDGVTEIGDFAFFGCNKLLNPNMPSSIEKIGNSSFREVQFNEDIKFGPNLITLDDFAFESDNSPKEDVVYNVKLPAGIKSIGTKCFKNREIRSINLPSSLESIGQSAFESTYITDLVIPEKIKAIESNGFSNMPKLYSVSLPEGLEEIGAYAFENSPAVKLNIPSTVTTIGERAFYGTNLLNCVIPDGVTSVGQNLFSDIKYLTIGKGIKSINKTLAYNVDILEMLSATPPTLGSDRLGFTPKLVIVPEGAGDSYTKNNRWKDYTISARNSKKAFVYLNEPGTLAVECRVQTGIMPGLVTNLVVEGIINADDLAVMRSNMTSCYDINLSGVTNTSLPDGAFAGKTTLLQLSLPNNLTEIGNSAFSGCALLHIPALPETLTTIGGGAFSDCQSMDNDLKMPASLKSVGENAFSDCQSLRSVDFGGCSDLYLGAAAFSSCKAMETAILPYGLPSIPDNLFSNSGLHSVNLPEGLTEIGASAFSDTYYLTDVTFPSTLKTIGTEAFSSSCIRGADLPESLETIGEAAFQNSSIAYVDIPGNVTEISPNAFYNCPFLLVANLPSSLVQLNENSFSSSSLAAITSPSLNPAATNGNPFVGVNNYTCSLTIPKPSFSKYLSAEFWGAFVNIRNWIDVTQNIAPSSDGGEVEEVEITFIDEEDYQEMLENEAEETPEEPVGTRARALRTLRKAGKIGANKGYGRLFNGASLYAEDNARLRYFFKIPENMGGFHVAYNGRDITNKIDQATMSFLADPLTSISSLVISDDASIIDCENDSALNDATAPVYNLAGVIVGYGKSALENLEPGVYIMSGKKFMIQ